MTRHRRLRMLGLALAAAAAWTFAPLAATADGHRGDRFEGRDHGRYERRDHARYEQHYRGYYETHDRWKHRDRWEHRDRERWEQRRYGRPARWGPPRFAFPYELYLRPIARVGFPFYCREHRVGFRYRGPFDDHLVRFHHLPYWQLPRLVGHVGFGWTFGY